ncbi:hypothetical protein D5H75_31875 [Bailinhaonella thermotolerans]|uniref:Uncharacterized protein n=1 Tax=Bailinhaonella thermotolerans TaxID=1070861 RepID=A0A3A4AB20_9ACTN|nr:hypothetical protein D5H75_31875 [Bailinhaonella thermotolerans]
MYSTREQQLGKELFPIAVPKWPNEPWFVEAQSFVQGASKITLPADLAERLRRGPDASVPGLTDVAAIEMAAPVKDAITEQEIKNVLSIQDAKVQAETAIALLERSVAAAVETLRKLSATQKGDYLLAYEVADGRYRGALVEGGDLLSKLRRFRTTGKIS